MPDYEFEKAAVNSGFSCICGVRRGGQRPAGRSCLRGGGNSAQGRGYQGA